MATTGYLGGSFEVFSVGSAVAASGLGVCQATGIKESASKITKPEQRSQEAPHS